MTALRKFLFLARNDVLRVSAVPMVAQCPSFGAGANVAALRLYSLPRGVRQR